MRDYGFYGLDTSMRVHGRPVPAVVGFRGSPPPALPIVSGRLADRPREAVLGVRTADELGIDVGDRCPVLERPRGRHPRRGAGRGRRLRGLPPLGPFLSERTGLGLGTYVQSPSTADDSSVALTAIRLRPGVDPRRFLADIGPSRAGWDALQGIPVTHAAPVRPPEIANVDGATCPLPLRWASGSGPRCSSG